VTDGSKKRLEYEVVLNVGGSSVLSSRVDEKRAGQVAMAFGMNWPSECEIRWPLIVRKVGVRPEIEGQALANALRQIVEIPDGDLVIWIAGKKGILEAGQDAGDREGLPKIMDTRAALAEIGRIMEKAEGEDWGWVVKTAQAGEVLAK